MRQAASDNKEGHYLLIERFFEWITAVFRLLKTKEIK